jgi:hypothetical protein
MNTNTLPVTNEPSLASVPIDLPLGLVKMLSYKGTFCSIKMQRPMKMRKGRAEIVKISQFTVRVGVSYDSQIGVKERRENGELPEENAGLIGREWIIPNYILRSLKSGKMMIRVTPVHNDACKRLVEYIRNGKSISKGEAEIDCLASEFADRGDWKGAMDITAEYITEVNGEVV